jgi:NAD(P)-dependent dehydrogenase (short-subunit alcohol dehydrogenase family)
VSGVAFVTGAGSGIGAAVARRLAADGQRVAAFDLDPVRLEQLADEVVAARLAGDVASEADVAAAVAAAEALGPIELLVNVAGITGGPEVTTCHRTDPAEWDRVFAVNVRGSFLPSRAVLGGMVERGSGAIVNIASAAGILSFPERCAYTASKGAVIAFTRSLAADYARYGIRANAVCPGMVETPMTSWRIEDAELGPRVLARIPQGRVAQPEEIAAAVAFLAGEDAGYCNGAALAVDGGWTAV